MELVLEVTLIPIWGYYGACAGSVVGEIVFTATGLALCRLLRIGSIDWKALFGAARAAFDLGRTEDARRDYEQFIRVAPAAYKQQVNAAREALRRLGR